MSLKVKLTQAKTYIPVTCAVCSTVTNELLLGSDVVTRLQAQCWDDQSASYVDGDNKVTVVLGDDVSCNTDNNDHVIDVCV